MGRREGVSFNLTITMNIYEDESFIVKPSLIEGYGVFAKRNFKNGETVLSWRPTKLSDSELLSIPEDQKGFLEKLADGTTVLMNAPERYVNSSETPNTRVAGESDVAIRDIQEGEEITSHYDF